MLDKDEMTHVAMIVHDAAGSLIACTEPGAGGS